MKLDHEPASGRQMNVNVYAVGPAYFDSFGAHLLAGRDFNAQDTVDKPHVYIISEHLAQNYFHGRNAIGRMLPHFGQVVGVVSDLRDQGLRNQNQNTVYQAASQLLTSGLSVFVRCNGRCQPLLETMRKAIQEVDPNTPVFSLHTMRTAVDGALSSEQALGFRSTLFALLAMLLTATGLYGVLSYMLARRTREIGLRIAIGASTQDIVALFGKELWALVGLGTIIGIPTALAVADFLKSQLFGIQPNDSRSIVAAVTCIVTVALIASMIPVRRAVRINPQQALKVD